MNVTNTPRALQYEVEQSIRTAKAAAERKQGQNAGQAAQDGKASVRSVDRPEAVQAASAGQKQEAVSAVGQGRPPQVDAYIPRGPHAPIEDETEQASTPGGENAASRPDTSVNAQDDRRQDTPRETRRARGAEEAKAGPDNAKITDRVGKAADEERAERKADLPLIEKKRDSEEEIYYNLIGKKDGGEEGFHYNLIGQGDSGEKEIKFNVIGQKDGAEQEFEFNVIGQKDGAEQEFEFNVVGQKDGAEQEIEFNVIGQKDGDKQTDRVEQDKAEDASSRTQKVEREVLSLKTKLEQLQRQMRAEKSSRKAEELEKRIIQLRREVLWKSSPAYYRQSSLADSV